MCRWLAYLGEPLRLESLMYCAKDSFVGQSLHAKESTYQVNGDGCGIGWYGNGPNPGVFHTTRPAWNSGNLHHLAEQLSSHLFLAHVRATSGTAIQESNCHPFRFKNMLFQHNGVIREYEKLKRSLDMAVGPELYHIMEGSTDTERMFFLALTHGLLDDVPIGLSRMVRTIEQIASDQSVDNAIVMTAVVSTGDALHAVRYSTMGKSPTLYHSNDLQSLAESAGETERLPEESVILLSEPLDDVPSHWIEIPESTLLTASPAGVSTQPFPVGDC